MAVIPYNTHIDLSGNEIQNANFQNLPSAPTNPTKGRFYFDTTINELGYFNGTTWIYGEDLSNYVLKTTTINGYALTGNISLDAGDVGALPDSTTINDLTSSTQQAALNSGIDASKVAQIKTNADNIQDIQELIPTQASASNQLADKDFVNSSLQTNSATFDGSWPTYAAIPTTAEGFTSAGFETPTNNNYLVVEADETHDGARWRYKYASNGTTYDKANWKAEYEINETPFTAAQNAALNSGITAELVAQIDTNKDNIASLETEVQELQTAISSAPKKLTAVNTALTTAGGVCSWGIANTLGTADVNVSIYRITDGVQVMAEVDTSASSIIVKFNSTANIAANTYKAVIIG